MRAGQGNSAVINRQSDRGMETEEVGVMDLERRGNSL